MKKIILSIFAFVLTFSTQEAMAWDGWTHKLIAHIAEPYLTDFVISEMKCVGSLLIIALSLNMLGITKIKVMNYVPAVFFPILICMFF